MDFPNKEEVTRVVDKMKNVEPTLGLPKNAPQVDRLKFEMCKIIVAHIRKSGISQAQLTKNLKISRARLNKIVKYNIDQFTADELYIYAVQIHPKLKIVVD